MTVRGFRLVLVAVFGGTVVVLLGIFLVAATVSPAGLSATDTVKDAATAIHLAKKTCMAIANGSGYHWSNPDDAIYPYYAKFSRGTWYVWRERPGCRFASAEVNAHDGRVVECRSSTCVF